jgi:hypothetical protein
MHNAVLHIHYDEYIKGNEKDSECTNHEGEVRNAYINLV